jgi:2'-5' RNA ligase
MKLPPKKQDIRKSAEAITVNPIKINVNEISLIRSDLTHAGPIYTPISIHPFQSP